MYRIKIKRYYYYYYYYVRLSFLLSFYVLLSFLSFCGCCPSVVYVLLSVLLSYILGINNNEIGRTSALVSRWGAALIRTGIAVSPRILISWYEILTNEISHTGNIALRNSYTGNIALRNSYTGNIAFRNSYTGNIAFRNSYTGNIAFRNSYTGNIPII